VRHGLPGVGEQVHQHLVEGVGIPQDRWQRAIEACDNLYIVRRHGLLQKLDAFFHDGVQVERDPVTGRVTSERPQAGRDPGNPLTCPVQDLQVFQHLTGELVVLGVHQHQLDASGHDPERVVHLVRDARRHRA
jgi:hypothetical protein